MNGWERFVIVSDIHGDRSDAQAVVEQIGLIAKEVKCDVLPYDKRRGVYALGKLNILHGFFAGKYAAKQHARIQSV